MTTSSATRPTARRMFELFEPVHLVTYFTEEPDQELAALGMRNYWDGYFASRGAALGVGCPAAVVDAVFYNFGPGEVARHLPHVWSVTTPHEAFAARQRGAVRALRRVLGDAADGADLARVADLLLRAAQSAPTEGRPLFAGLREMPVPDEPVARLYHAATLLREHRGDGHTAALLTHRIGRTECHALLAVDLGETVRTFGRSHHLPADRLDATVADLQRRGVLADAGTFTPAGRALKDSIESTTDALAEAPWEALDDDELHELVALLEPLVATLQPHLTF